MHMNNLNIIICVVFVLFVRMKGNNLFPLICRHIYTHNNALNNAMQHNINFNPTYIVPRFTFLMLYTIVVASAHSLFSIAVHNTATHSV